MTDASIDHFPIDDDILLDETGDPDPADITGDWTDNTDEEDATDAAH